MIAAPLACEPLYAPTDGETSIVAAFRAERATVERTRQTP
jgi:hypothetical protein